MRKRIKVLIKSEAPLAISEGFKGGWAVPTKEYIPGSTVRGALADYLIKSRGLTEMKKMLLSPGTAVLDFNPVQLSPLSGRGKESWIRCRQNRGCTYGFRKTR